MSAPPAPFVSQEHHGRPGYAVMVVGFGSPESHAGVLDRFRRSLPPLVDSASPMPYVALQQMFDEAAGWGLHCYEKGLYLESFSEGAIDVITQHVPLKRSPLSMVFFYRLDGAYAEVGEEDTAFSGRRSPCYAVFVVAQCPAPELLVADRPWVRSFWEALLPHTPGVGSYINAMTEVEEDRLRAAYGTKYDRLAAIKATYDPENVFHRNANIRPRG